MKTFSILPRLSVVILLFLMTASGVLAGAFEDRVATLKSNRTTLQTEYEAAQDDDTKEQILAKVNMIDRQLKVATSFTDIEKRVKALQADDPKKSNAEASLNNSKTPRDTFMELNVANQLTDEPPYQSDAEFNDAEKAAIKAINQVNQMLLAPKRPGNVPQGDIIEDFIPGLIRLLFRFASLGVLVSFVVSGVYFVIAFGNEERVTKAKHMLYYSLIGFAFVTLAFAIVKAVTDIDFFGFI